MPSLSALLTGIVAAAFERAGLPPSLGAVTPSSRPDLAQFQCNGALAGAKLVKQPPRALAERIAEDLRGVEMFSAIDLAGPGFINLSLTDQALAGFAAGLAADPRLGVPLPQAARTVLIDFGGPNVAKPMHVGHLRSSIIGDSLQRVARFCGDRTVSDIHLGDWGLPMGQLIAEMARRRPDLPYFDPASGGPYPAASPVTMAELEEAYPAASAACKADPARMEEARRATAELQQGQPGYRALWRHFVEVSVADVRRITDRLGVHFDLWKGESDVDPLIPPMVERLRAAGIAVDSEGAVVVPVAEPGDRKEVPPLILVKSDGAAMYGTTDLATIIDRTEQHHPDAVLYVVDERQHLHFEQVFRAARKAGLDGGARLEHVGFGTMNGPDGKPFKTRAGGVMKLQDLIDMTVEQARARLDEAGLGAALDPAERAEIADAVAIAALKFADLSNHRLSNYIFDLERFTRFEGRTGPYLQYAAVRVKSLLRRAAEEGVATGAILPPGDGERDLILQLGRLPDVIASAHEKSQPNEICDYVHGLTQEFSRFYAACPILTDPDPAIRGSRLALAQLSLRAIDLCLDLLGIVAPERM